MKRILIIFSLIYFISCKTLCTAEEALEDSKDCFTREAQDTSYNCCYMTTKDSSDSLHTQCFEGPKRMKHDVMKENIQGQLPTGFTLTDFACPEEKEEDKVKCGDRTVPGEFKECFDRSVIVEENNCCYYKLSGVFDMSGCIEIPSTYDLDAIREKYFKQYLEKGINVDALVCPTEGDSSKQTPQGSECTSEIQVASKQECYSRKTRGDNYSCCFMKIEGNGDALSLCSEIEKGTDQSDVEKKINEQYSVYGFKVTDFVCPSPSSEDVTTTKDDNGKDNVKETNKGNYLRSTLLLIFALLI